MGLMIQRLTSWGLFFVLLLGQVSIGFAQSTSPSAVNPQTGMTNTPYPSVNSSSSLMPTFPNGTRVSGGSFGQKELPIGTSTGIPSPAYPVGPFEGLSYQVHILGEVAKPGTYRIAASTRLYEALQVAGGVSRQGSERRVELRRSGGRGRSVDLLSFKKLGNLNENPYLLDNDVIFVPLRDKAVRIEGTIKRPGVYELKKEKNLEDIIQFAGGLTPGALNSGPIKIVRYIDGKKAILNVEDNEDDRQRFLLRNGDVIIVPHFLTVKKKFDYNLATLPGDNALFYPSFEERVSVLGAVGLSGPLPYNPYFNVGQYITEAGGVTKLAKRHKISIINSQGVRTKAWMESEVSPGDAIIVPEKYMPPESFVALVLGISTSVLGITTTILTLTR